MTVQQILIALSAGDSPALGSIWRITAKKTDFYLEPTDKVGGVAHLSVHGPNERFDGHQFHIKVDSRAEARVATKGNLVLHGLPLDGFAFDGMRVADRAYLVARIRWRWHLQRERFRVAAISGALPELGDNKTGARLSTILEPNDAWDVDLVVSYDQPHWPDSSKTQRDNSRLGPLANDAGLWLTATSYHRSELKYPTPEHLLPRLPRPGEAPNRMVCGGPGPAAARGMYWFVETITSRELIEANRPGPSP